MVEGGDYEMMGWWEKSIFIQVRREEGMTSHTFWSDSQNSINISALMTPLSSPLFVEITIVN